MSNFKHFILIVSNTFTQRDYDRFGIALLHQYYESILILNIEPIYYKTIQVRNLHAGIDLSCDSIQIVNCFLFEELTKIMNQYAKSALFFFAFDITSKTVNLFRLATKLDIFMVYGVFNTIAGYEINDIRNKIRIYTSYFKFKNILMYLKLYLYLKLKLIKPFDLIILSSAKSLAMISKRNLKSAKFYTHTMDYDLYLKNSKTRQQALLKQAYIVFLDEFAPYHPDYEKIGIYFDQKQKDLYYQQINTFFKLIETKTKLQVVVAAHPRSGKFYLENDCFKGRKVFLNKTIELVQHAKLCITHESTAVNFAILYQKPIVFISGYACFLDSTKIFIQRLAKTLDKEAIVLKDSINTSKLFIFNDKAYERYIRNYISIHKNTPKEQMYIWEIFIQEMKQRNLLAKDF